MNTEYNIILTLSTILVLIFFGIGVYIDAKKSLHDLREKDRIYREKHKES